MARYFSDLKYLLSLYIKDYLGNVTVAKFAITFFFCFLLIEFGRKIIKHDNKQIRSIVYAFYFSILISITLLGRSIGCITNSFLTLFSTWYVIVIEKHYYQIYEMIFNFVMFIPEGIIVFFEIRNTDKAIAIVFLTSLLIETVQLLLGIGLFEISDLLCNTSGGIVGCYILSTFINYR